MLRPGPHREGEEPKPMMHERGKSDSAVRAVKPANKAERSAAELVEQRAGTQGNADQQSTRRAQERESVSQALGRIRQAAKQRKKEKFTALFHHISVGLLRLAFFEIKKDAAPGVDGLTWQDYEADLDRNIEDLHDRVQRGAYRAQPSRRLYIPRSFRGSFEIEERWRATPGSRDRPTRAVRNAERRAWPRPAMRGYDVG